MQIVYRFKKFQFQIASPQNQGRTASYTMQPDDLYVRAKVASPHNANTNNREPNFPIAWTQPISAKDML